MFLKHGCGKKVVRHKFEYMSFVLLDCHSTNKVRPATVITIIISLHLHMSHAFLSQGAMTVCGILFSAADYPFAINFT